MEETKKLARFATDLKYEDLPESVIEKAKELILDQIGCQLAGSTLPWSKRALEFVADFSGQRRESTIVNHNTKMRAQDASFVNASFGHGFMGDDTDSVCHAHFGSIIIPAALAVAERESISGKEFIKGVVVGYEVASRIGAAAPLGESRGFHPGPVFGPFGVAACVGKVLRFNESQMLDALGVAGSHSSGLMEYSKSGGTINRLHSSIAAYNGIRSALLAQKGFRGPATIIEGERGFVRAFSGESLFEKITAGLGQEFRVLLIDVKAYCCCGTLTATLDALSRIIKEHEINPKQIEEIIVNVSPLTFSLTNKTEKPGDITSAQFSGPFGIALRLVKGGNGFREYSEENLEDPGVLDLMAKVKLILDEDLGKRPGSDNPAKLRMRLSGDIVYEETVYAGKGSILNPMNKEEIFEKFRGLASSAVSDNRIETIMGTVLKLDLLGDIHELCHWLAAN